MGMYTQVRGFLCVGSISSGTEAEDKLKELKENFLERDDLERTWVCDDSVFFKGSNGSKWIFIGSEHKNYDASMEEWLKYLIENIRCEGRIEFQYEECDIGHIGKVWLISNSSINIQKYVIHTVGYGFGD